MKKCGALGLFYEKRIVKKMVLSLEEVNAAEKSSDSKMRLLLLLRRSTDRYLIQCLADREIQCLVHPNGKGSSNAYGYNCALVHNPHTCHKVTEGR